MSPCSDPEGIRPAWTHNNVGLFLFWMKTGSTEIPAGWVDPVDPTNVVNTEAACGQAQ